MTFFKGVGGYKSNNIKVTQQIIKVKLKIMRFKIASL